jgi:hypothetical protein
LTINRQKFNLHQQHPEHNTWQFLPAKVEQDVSGHGVVATHPVVEVDACPGPVERDVAVKQRIERLGLKKETVLLCVYTQLMSQVHDDTRASGLVASARVEAHARHRAAVGEAPLSVCESSKCHGSHDKKGCAT